MDYISTVLAIEKSRKHPAWSSYEYMYLLCACEKGMMYVSGKRKLGGKRLRLWTLYSKYIG